MPNLSTYTNKLGKKAGRKAYNAAQQVYRDSHRRKIRRYNKAYYHRNKGVDNSLLQ